MARKFYITTAIDYANDEPHLGTAYEKVGTDVIARFRRLEGDQVHFQTGNDEHSINVQRAAAEAGLPPKEYCDRRSATNRALWQRLGISFDNFIQTSEPRHHHAVRTLLERLYQRGHIYKGRYRGLYCDSCEAFYLPKDLVDGKCPDHDRPPAEIEEENYFFSLSSYRERLLDLFAREPQRLVPEVRRNEIVSLLRSGLEDISISRATATWGIPLPWDPAQVTYVWFDALINYLTAVGYGSDEERFRHWWPADLHVIGKSITRFHAIIWPAMLLAADLPLPCTVFSHGFIYLKGRKMSKSLGNVVRPLDLVDTYGADPLRYYVLCEGSFGRDRDFLWENFIHRYNSDLGNDLGNLVHRTLNMIQRYLGGRVRRPTDGGGIGLPREVMLRRLCLGALDELRVQLDPQGDDLNFHLALQAIWRIVDAANKYVGEAEPWRLARQGASDRVAAVLYVLVEALRFVAILLAPFLPETGARVWQALGLEALFPFAEQRFAALVEWGRFPDGVSVQLGAPLFPRITVVPEEEPAAGRG